MTSVSLVPSRSVNGDLGVVNAARVSFAKERDQILLSGDPRIPRGESGDDRLISYLANNGHWSPLAHPHFGFSVSLDVNTLVRFACKMPTGVRLMPQLRANDPNKFIVVGSLYGLLRALPVFDQRVQDTIVSRLQDACPISCEALGFDPVQSGRAGYRVAEVEVLAEAQAANPDTYRFITRTFRLNAPIFVARQLVKHQIELVWNEESRRYIDSEPEFAHMLGWRKQAPNAKQASSSETIRCMPFTYNNGEQTVLPVDMVYENHCASSLNIYEQMLKAGVAREQARTVLPVSAMTQWWWTGSVDAFARVVRNRIDTTHAQPETAEVARLIDAQMADDLGNHWQQAKEWEARRA